jgi:hypothetical protein
MGRFYAALRKPRREDIGKVPAGVRLEADQSRHKCTREMHSAELKGMQRLVDEGMSDPKSSISMETANAKVLLDLADDIGILCVV